MSIQILVTFRETGVEKQFLLFAFHPKATRSIYRQVFWLIQFRLPSHFTFRVTVAGGAGTIIGFTAAGTAPGFLSTVRFTGHGIPYSLRPEWFRPEHLKSSGKYTYYYYNMNSVTILTGFTAIRRFAHENPAVILRQE